MHIHLTVTNLYFRRPLGIKVGVAELFFDVYTTVLDGKPHRVL